RSGISDVVTSVINRNPELFYIASRYVYYMDGQERITKLELGVKDGYSLADVRNFNTVSEKILGEINTSWTDHQKLIYIHDYLVTHINYDKTLTKRDVYTALVGGSCVCQGYALAFAYLANRVNPGFDCTVVTSNGINHAWNMVTLNGVKYYVDATWDDPSNQDRDIVLHRYLMVPESSFNGGHSLDVFYISRFPGINSRLASVDFFPKTGDISTAMNYLNGVWFYSYRGSVYRWDGHSSLPTVESSIPRDNNRCVAVINDTLYIGGSDGVSTYDPNSHMLTSQGSTPVSGFIYYNKALYYKSGSTWTRFIEKNTPDVAYTDLNGDKNSEVIELPVPTKPTIKAKKTSAKSIRVSVTKRSDNATGGYQVQFSTSKSFKSGVKKITIKGSSASKAGLSSHKTYYVRCRGIWKTGGHIYTKYGAWSAVKKVKL
ncbi:MAG: hypothetical protein IJM01_04905, partial [Eubacterium sp.]|nr:hypothetical protein [Eubacterium sp.]